MPCISKLSNTDYCIRRDRNRDCSYFVSADGYIRMEEFIGTDSEGNKMYACSALSADQNIYWGLKTIIEGKVHVER
jgi:hypothetical protein